MIYQLFEMTHVAMRPARAAADGCRMFFQHPLNPMAHTPVGRSTAAACEVFERTTRRYDKPVFGLNATTIGGLPVRVVEEVVWQRPFCRMIHFRRDCDPARLGTQPKLLLVAPMSGHFATLLRGTVETFLPDHEVYITDWVDAREMPLSAGRFDLDDYVDYMREMFTHLAGDLHVFAVCQPSVPVLAAVARMEAENDPNVPHTVIMAGGPIDTRVSPTVVNTLAVEKGTDWFRRNVINSVPWPSAGFGRHVYPGFLQLTGFMTMNLDRHMKAHKDLFFHLVDGDGDSAEKHRDFYDEYLAVMDLTAEFYLQTIETVFVEHRLPRGEMTHRGKPVDLGAIRRVAIMTIEGEKDDITGVGQCSAAIQLCHNVPAANKQHFECPRVGHYGIFNGTRFRSDIAPRMRHFMRRFDPATSSATASAYQAESNVERLDERRGKRARDNEAAAFSFPNRRDDTYAAAFAPAPEVAAVAGGGRALPIGVLAAASAMRLWSATGRAVLETMASPIIVRAAKSD